MNLKSKLFGFGAAAVLSLSMVTGAMGAETKQTTGTAVLEGGECSVSATASLGFGGWFYDGYEYILNGSPETGEDSDDLQWVLTAGNPSGCNVRLGFAGLYNGSHHIGLENFYGQFWIDGAPGSAAMLNTLPGLETGGFGYNGIPSGGYAAFLRLTEVPDDVMPGTYNGTIFTTVANTQ